jgi:hypothetical protein
MAKKTNIPKTSQRLRESRDKLLGDVMILFPLRAC